MFSYHPIYRRANLNLLRTPHVSHKMKSHYRTETRTKKGAEKTSRRRHPSAASGCSPGPRPLGALPFPSRSRSSSAYICVSLRRVVAFENCSFLGSTRLVFARVGAFVAAREPAVCLVQCRVEVPKWRVSLPQDGGPMPPSTNTTLVKVSVL